ncbi:MAG: diguanylate cyclase [Magnetococcales bacterium]|nr:diguanylate cyclase [Magnetococcales bacterium]
MTSLPTMATSIVSSEGDLTILSAVVAFLAMFLTLELAARPFAAQSKHYGKRQLLAGTLVLGLGLWTMHQVALVLQSLFLMGTDYVFHLVHPQEILPPMLAALAVAYGTMRILLFHTLTIKNLFIVSLLLTLGIPIIILATLLAGTLPGDWHGNIQGAVLAGTLMPLATFIALYLALLLPSQFQMHITSRLTLASILLVMTWIICHNLFLGAIYIPDLGKYLAKQHNMEHEWTTFLVIYLLVIIIITNYWHLFQVRAQLEKNIHDLHLAQDIAHMGTWDWNLETDEVQWSQKLARIYGIETMADHGRANYFTHAIHPGDRVDVLQCRREARQNPKGQWSIRYRINRPDGKILQVREHGRTLTDRQQRPIRLLATVADVTHIYDMEKREERVMQSQIALSALLETGLEPLTLEKQLQIALHIILTVPWVSLQYQGSIFLTDPDSGDLLLASQVGLSETQCQVCSRVKPGYCLCGRALQYREIIFASQIDARHEISYPDMHPHGHYCVPILSRNRVLGVLNLYVPNGYKKNNEEDAFLTTIANSLAGLIDLRRTQDKLRNEQEFIATILSTAPSLVVVLNQAGEIILFNHACQLLTGYTQETIVGRKIGEVLIPKEEIAALQEKLDTILPGTTPQEHESHWLTQKGDKRLIAWSFTAIDPTPGTGRHIIGTGVDISEKRLAEQKLQFLASHDSLTGLPNRVQFMEHLLIGMAQARRTGRHLAVMFLDLDRFKPINDTLGHEVGDQLLIAAAQRIRSSVREMDVVARIGGDEFTVLMTGFNEIDHVATSARKIVSNLGKTFEIGPHRCHIGTSIGISLFPAHADDPQILLKKADQAMYAIKEAGRNNFKIWDETC